MTRKKPSPWGKIVLAVSIALLLAACGVMLPGCGSRKKTADRAGAQPARKVTVCPLCGREVTGPAVIERRAVAVKVDNEPAARPPSGLDKACVTYEEMTEGGITRYMAIFLCRNVETVGPVRSARSVDIELVYPYYALLAHCGAGGLVLQQIKQSGIPDIDEIAWTGAYWRTSQRGAPHNLYTSTARIRQAGEGAYPFQRQVTPPFKFLSADGLKAMLLERDEEARKAALAKASNPQVPYQPSVTLVNNILIPYNRQCAVTWQYDPATTSFSRNVASRPMTDPAGVPVKAETVIVQYVTEGPSTVRDVNGEVCPDLGVVGSGRAQVFTAGRLIDANWEKSSRTESTRFLDNAGRSVRIKPGNVWIELVAATKQTAVQ